VAPPSVVEAVEQADLIARLETALARLPARSREGVLLRYVHGLSHAEVAAVLGISIAATEKQITRTLDKLRTWLAD
jgi:RNA polymerase sigma-70 factor (ECF subfamily)